MADGLKSSLPKSTLNFEGFLLWITTQTFCVKLNVYYILFLIL